MVDQLLAELAAPGALVGMTPLYSSNRPSPGRRPGPRSYPGRSTLVMVIP